MMIWWRRYENGAVGRSTNHQKIGYSRVQCTKAAGLTWRNRSCDTISFPLREGWASARSLAGTPFDIHGLRTETNSFAILASSSQLATVEKSPYHSKWMKRRTKSTSLCFRRRTRWLRRSRSFEIIEDLLETAGRSNEPLPFRDAIHAEPKPSMECPYPFRILLIRDTSRSVGQNGLILTR